jgi:hypothetical protein
MSLQIVHLVEGLTLKLSFAINLEYSLVIVVGISTLTRLNADEKLILLCINIAAWNKLLKESA